MDKGDLSIAMRASISAPGVFAPAETQGQLLVDGGLAENLPIDVARQMHADILIVSDVSFPLQPRAALDSALSISNQMLAILVRKDADRQRATLGAHGCIDRARDGHGEFDRLQRGGFHHQRRRKRGAQHARRLEALSVGDAAYTDYLVRRAAREPGLPAIKFVRVDEQSKRYEKTIMAEMQPLVGKPLNVQAVGERITDLYGLGNFETLDYALVDQGKAPMRSPASKYGRGANHGVPTTCALDWIWRTIFRATAATTRRRASF